MCLHTNEDKDHTGDGDDSNVPDLVAVGDAGRGLHVVVVDAAAAALVDGGRDLAGEVEDEGGFSESKSFF